MRFLLFLLAGLIFASTSTFSQNGGQNFFKYWTYRYRLDQWIQKGWVDLSSCPPYNKVYGYSIPPSAVFPANQSLRIISYEAFLRPEWDRPKRTDYCKSDAHLDLPWCYDPYILEHGDGGQQLGWYMAMLATEYKLLKDQNLPTDSTALELFYALETLYRLDYLAENVNPYGTVDHPNHCDLNGFFIRQDIDRYMVYPQTGDPRTDYNREFGFYKNTEIRSGHNNDPNYTPLTNPEPEINWGTRMGFGNALSLDQITHICLGLKCIKTFLPSGATILEEAGLALPGQTPHGGHLPWSYNFHNRVDEIALKLLDYMDSNDYNLKYPNTDKGIQYPSQIHHIFPLRKMIMGITNNIPDLRLELIPAYEASKLFWNAIKFDIFGYSDLQSYNAALILNMAVVGDSWSISLRPPGATIPLDINVTTPFVSAYAMQPFRLPYILLNFTPGLGYVLTDIFGAANGRRMDIYPLFHQQFHNTGSLYTRSGYEILMNKADCSGPRSFITKNSYAPYDDWANNVGPKEWRASNRYEKPERRDIADKGEPGHRNGLDYMSLYNLFNITFPDYVGRDDNNLNNDINIDFPSGNYGSVNDPAYIFGFNYVNYENHSTGPDAKVDFVSVRAKRPYAVVPNGNGTNDYYLHGGIRFGNGTRLRGEIHAYIQRTFECRNYAMRDLRESDDCEGCLIVPNPPETDTVEVGNADEIRYYDNSRDPVYDRDSVLDIFHNEYGYSYDQLDSISSGLADKNTYISLIRHIAERYGHPDPFDTTGQNGGNPRMESLRQTNKKPAIAVYPNPFQSGFDIRFTLPEQEKITITVLNSLGVPVLQIVQDQNYPAGTHELSVDGSTLTAGVYCCKVGIGNKTIQTFNLIKTQ